MKPMFYEKPSDIKSIYDFGLGSYDRFVFVYKSSYKGRYGEKLYHCLCTCSTGQGFSQHSACQLGRHLGKKVEWADIPRPLRQHVTNRLKEGK